MQKKVLRKAVVQDFLNSICFSLKWFIKKLLIQFKIIVLVLYLYFYKNFKKLIIKYHFIKKMQNKSKTWLILILLVFIS